MSFILKILILPIFIVIVAFFVRKNMNDQAHYQVYIGYPKGYISEFNNAHSVMKNEKGEAITSFGGDNATEGTLGSGVQNSSDAKMEVPSKMEVMWFSITENQFWRGEFELPKKELAKALNNEKILGLFTVSQTDIVDKYDKIVVNVAPKGKVYVYLGGMSVKLIGIYQAQPITYDWLQHIDETWAIKGVDIPTQEQFVLSMKNDYGSIVDEIDQHYKEGFFTPVRWKLSIKGNKKILAFVVHTLNGEYTQFLENPKEQEIKSIPTSFSFDVEENGKVNRYNVELKNSYEFYKKHFSHDAVVNVIVDIPDPDHIFLYFKQGDKTVEYTDFIASELDR